MNPWPARVLAGMAVVAIVGGWAAAWHSDRERIRAVARAQAAELREAGFAEGLAVAERRVGEHLNTLQRELERLRESGAAPVAAAVVGTEAVDVPGAEDLRVAARVEALVGAAEDGTLHAAGSVAVELEGRLGESVVDETVRLPIDPAATSLQFSDELRDALRAYRARSPRFMVRPRPPSKWRAGWSAGPGVIVSPDGRVSAGAAVVWGAQF